MYKLVKNFELFEPVDLKKDGIKIGVTRHGIFYLPIHALFNHMAIFGKTNTGKSTLLLNIVIQLIESNHTLIIIDPHGMLSDNILAHIPDYRKQDLVYISPNFLNIDNQYFGITLNAMQINTSLHPIQREMQILRVTDHIKALFSRDPYFSNGTWGPRLELIFTVLTRALLHLNPNATIIDLLDILIDKHARAAFLRRTHDEDVILFLKSLYKSPHNIEYIFSTINKLLPIKKNIFIKELIASITPSTSFEKLLSANPIIIVNLSKSQLSEQLSTMIGSIIIHMVWSAILTQHYKTQTFLVIDEVQNFPALDLKNMLSEGRKYGLCLLLATQHMSQLHRDMLNAILGNVSNIGVFTLGASDAYTLKSVFTPVPYMQERLYHLLQNLERTHLLFRAVNDKYNVILSIHTLLPPTPVNDQNEVQYMLQQSIKKHGRVITLTEKNYDFILYVLAQMQSRKHRPLKFMELYNELKVLNKTEISELDLVLRSFQTQHLIQFKSGFYVTVEGEKYLGAISEVARVLNEGEYHRYLLNRACQYLSSIGISCKILTQSPKEMPDAIIKVKNKVINIEAEFGNLSKKVVILKHLILFKSRPVIFLTFEASAEKLYQFLARPYMIKNGKIVPYTYKGKALNWTDAGQILARCKIWIVPEPGQQGTIKQYKF